MRKKLAALVLIGTMAFAAPGCTVMGIIFGFSEKLGTFIWDYVIFNDAMKEGFAKGYSVLPPRKSMVEKWHPALQGK